MTATLPGTYARAAAGETIRARAISLYLDGLSCCQIARQLRSTTTPRSVRDHLRAAGLAGLHWCPSCQIWEPV